MGQKEGKWEDIFHFLRNVFVSCSTQNATFHFVKHVQLRKPLFYETAPFRDRFTQHTQHIFNDSMSLSPFSSTKCQFYCFSMYILSRASFTFLLQSQKLPKIRQLKSAAGLLADPSFSGPYNGTSCNKVSRETFLCEEIVIKALCRWTRWWSPRPSSRKSSLMTETT